MTPLAGLVADAGGRLYGTTAGGVSGRVYRVDGSGSFGEVYDLGVVPGFGGVRSRAPLLRASDGHLYGTTDAFSGGPPPANAAGSFFRLSAAAAGRDLVVTATSDPPALAAPGTSFAVSDATTNRGAVPAGPSTTRFYLSADATKGAGDLRLTGTRAVADLAAAATSTGSTSVTVPASAAPGVYRLLACADDTAQVVESDELNNCLAAGAPVEIRYPDLAATAVSTPPAALAPGSKVAVTDTVANLGTVDAPASRTRYYLSLDAVKDPADTLLTGARAVPILAPGGASTGTRSVTVPAGAPLGTFRLLACADDQRKIAETNEANNCVASTGTLRVERPDLTTASVTGLPATAPPGGAFTLRDEVVNQGLGPAKASKTRYYLSADASAGAGDILLVGVRSVPILAPGASSSGSKLVTVPAGAPPGTYFALACADDLASVAESLESNNCAASGATVVIAP
jgi:subtilase family serine protease